MKLSTEERHSNLLGPVPLRPTPKLSEGLLRVKPVAAVIVNSKYFAESIEPPIAPASVEPIPQLLARKLPVLELEDTPFLVMALIVRFSMEAPL